jgi:cellulose synthase/poly-beta-1,6-N-acetylglucosamine synthase-like glycosyltransferase
VSKIPKVSILIAARNEEAVIERLLRSIEQLHFPKDEFEVLLGNDHSSDHTGQILEKYAQKYPNWKVFQLIDDPQSELRGKARVLELLAKNAEGEYLFFTDADISLPKHWLGSMLSHFTENIGVVVGTSSMENNGLFAKMQSMEWLSVLYFNKVMSDFKVETTGMGNNMAVSKKAYEAVGGYTEIGFSIVEDYALYKAIIDAGYGFKQSFEKDSHALTLPPLNFLEQRNRWIAGAVQSKSKFVIPAFLQAFSLPIYVFLAFWNWKISLGIWLTFLAFNIVVMVQSQRKLGLKPLLSWTPLFCIYVPISWAVQLWHYLWKGGKIEWKDRNYN